MVDEYWKLACEREIEFARKRSGENPEPATGKQLGLIRWLSRKLGVPIIPGIEGNKALCSAFIGAMTDYEHFLGLDETTKTHIRRIWRGELKADWTPECPWNNPVACETTPVDTLSNSIISSTPPLLKRSAV